MSEKVNVKRNPKEGEEGLVPGVWAKNIRWEPFFSEDGTLFSLVEWDMDSVMHLHTIVFPLIGQTGYRQELLRDHIYSQNGAVFIEFEKSEDSNVTSSTGAVIQVDPEIRPRRFQFGGIRFVLVPTHDNKTILVLQMERTLYTQNPWTFFEAFMESMGEKAVRTIHRRARSESA
jgi:hypothetical protein